MKLPPQTVLLFLAAVLPCAWGLSNEIQEVDPSQYAEVGRRMAESGDWAHLRDNAGPFLNKPPLTFWVMSAGFRLFGAGSFTARLPTALASLVLLWATFRMGRRLFDKPTAWVALALLGSSLAFQHMFADPKVDMVLSATVALSIALAIEAGNRPWRWAAAYVAVGLGVLAKGPVALALFACALFPELFRSPGPSSLRQRLQRVHLFSGLALVCLVAAPWYWQQFLEHGPEGVLFHLWAQGPGRILKLEGRDPTGPFFFFHTGLWAFLPSTPILLWELGERAARFVRARFALPQSDERVVLWWLVLPLLGLSLSGSKLPQYAYWLAAPAALFAARALSNPSRLQASPRACAVLEGVYWVLFGAVAVVLLAVLGWVFPASAFVLAAWTVFLGAAVAGTFIARRGPSFGLRLAWVAVAPLAAFGLFFQGYLHPALTRFQPYRELGELVRKEDLRGTFLPCVGLEPNNALSFYAQRPTRGMSSAEVRADVEDGRFRLAVASDEGTTALVAEGLRVEPLLRLPEFHTSIPTRAFLDPRTRAGTLRYWSLLRLARP